MSASGRTGAIPFLLGHVSIQTTERYFGRKKIQDDVNGKIGKEPPN